MAVGNSIPINLNVSDKIGDDHQLFGASCPFKPKAKILFLKLYHFPTFSPAF